MRILVVDSDYIARVMLYDRIKGFNRKIVTADSVDSATARIHEDARFDLAFLGTRFPSDPDGGFRIAELCKQKGIPFVGMSVVDGSTDAYAKQWMILGARRFIRKPFFASEGLESILASFQQM